MLSVGGAIGLGINVMADAQTNKLIALAIYCASVVGPCIWLASRRD